MSNSNGGTSSTNSGLLRSVIESVRPVLSALLVKWMEKANRWLLWKLTGADRRTRPAPPPSENSGNGAGLP